jgi:hypothetical protein
MPIETAAAIPIEPAEAPLAVLAGVLVMRAPLDDRLTAGIDSGRRRRPRHHYLGGSPDRLHSLVIHFPVFVQSL